MKKLSQTHRSAIKNCIVFGLPKSGKSELAGKLAEHFNLIWVDLENGHEVLYKLPQEWQERITLISLPDTRSYPIAIETCLKMVKGPVSICDKHGKVSCPICKRMETDAAKTVTDEQKQEVHEEYFTDVDLTNLPPDTIVVFDSLTQLSTSAIAHITKGEPDTYKLEYDDWGNLGKLMDIFLSHIQAGVFNCVVISHEQEVTTEGGKNMLVPVGGTRNFSRNTAKYFGHVIYAERRNKKHVFTSSTTASTTILAGSRSDVELEKSDEPSLLQIFKPELYGEVPAVKTKAASTVTNKEVKEVKEVKTEEQPAQVSESTPPAAKTGNQSAAEILAKLKAGRQK